MSGPGELSGLDDGTGVELIAGPGLLGGLAVGVGDGCSLTTAFGACPPVSVTVFVGLGDGCGTVA